MPDPTVPAIPAAALAIANTVYAARGVLSYTPAGAQDPIVFLCDLVDYDGTAEVSELKFPGTDGVIRPLRRDLAESSESLALKCYDIEKVIQALGGSLNGLTDGTAELWIRDPKDADAKVRLYAAPFACSAQRDGQVKFGEKTYSSATLKFTNTSADPITFHLNADLASEKS
jgi:hypothetical protein